MATEINPFGDVKKMIEQFKVPGINMTPIVDARRKDIEVLVAANKAAYESMAALARKIAAALLSAVLLPGGAFAQPAGDSVMPRARGVQPPHASVKAPSYKANPLAGGAEIFENLTEAAPVINAAAFTKSLAEFEALYPLIAQRLSAGRKARLDTLVAGVRNAWQRGDRGAMAIQSIEAYRLFQESIDHTGQPVPVEVSLLDYAGFKLNALLLSTQPDWKQIADTAQEASTWWTAIGPRITHKTLRDAMDQTVNGIKDAAARKNPELLRFAANMDLVLVDGLETFFSAHPRTH